MMDRAGLPASAGRGRTSSIRSRNRGVQVTQGAAAMIEVRDLRRSIRNGARKVEILKGIDFQVPAGQFVAIMGASGSGKRTLRASRAGWGARPGGRAPLAGGG